MLKSIPIRELIRVSKSFKLPFTNIRVIYFLNSITINDLNDNGPIFSQNDYTFHIQENQPRSTIVGQVSATDLDSSLFAPLEYSITDDQESVNFTIDKITGIIRSRQSLDREEKSHYAFRVLVKDTRMRLTEVSNSLSGSHGNSINSPLPMNIRYTGTTTVTNNINNMENTQSQYSLFGQVINIPETLGSSSSSSATSEKSSLSMMQANYDNNQNHLNSIQELNDDSVYQNPTALPYGNLLSNKQSYKTLGYTANDIMIICLSLIFSLVLIATLVLICLVRRRVTWFKSKDKNSGMSRIYHINCLHVMLILWLIHAYITKL
ncbi:unnamed protein product [Trichobilharzia regenti]|nr:unnamed protein product [Trichobilharzia regenti]